MFSHQTSTVSVLFSSYHLSFFKSEINIVAGYLMHRLFPLTFSDEYRSIFLKSSQFYISLEFQVLQWVQGDS